jgi:CheY-like chemotaxis protein
LAKVKPRGEQSANLSLDEAERAAMRAKELALQLLTFSRGGEPIKKPVAVGSLLHDSCDFIFRNSKSVCEVSAPDDLWPAYADEGQLSQVFHNLLINADQAMPNGGKVNITSENMVVPGQNEWQLKPGRYIKICIRDNGVGIPREYLPKIFDPFFTTKQKGSGLGLAIIYSIISKHDGHISVESDPGVGATFSIFLPASDESVQVQAAPEPEEQSLCGKWRILVMDDDEGIRRVAFNLLDYMGHEVCLARDGEETIELYQQAKDSGKPFDLLIIDLVVDKGMGGQEAMEILRRIDPQVKAIVSSGYSTDPVMSDFAKYGFIGVITKPYGINKLKEALRDILPKSSPTG